MAAALDFSSARPTPSELTAAGIAGCLAYLGSGKPRPEPDYIASLHAAGIWFVFIQESYASRAYEGYAAGQQDAQIAEADADAAGYPEECAIYVALGDTNRADAAQHLPGIAEYARGFGDALRRPAFGGYGSREAVDAACAAQPKMAYRWTVETWGARFDGYDHIVQMANTPSPIAGTDFDQTFADDVGQWPRSGGYPTPTGKVAPPMGLNYILKTPTQIVMVSDVYVEGFGPPDVDLSRASVPVIGVSDDVVTATVARHKKLEEEQNGTAKEAVREAVRQAVLAANYATAGNRQKLADIAAAAV